jgi:hypothetical protein
MPHLRIRNVDKEFLLKVSRRLTDRLQASIGCERSWLTLEHEACTVICDGAALRGNPFVQVLWFERPAETAQAVARILTEELRGDADFVTVVFDVLPEDLYFENGETL